MSVTLTTGVTISGASSFLAEIVAVDPPNPSRVAINTSHTATEDAHTFTPGKLVDWGECRVTIHHNPATSPPIDSDPEAWVITYGSGSGAPTDSFTGFLTNYEPTGELENKMTARVTIKVTGAVS